MQKEIFGDLGIGTRLRRVYDMLGADMERIYTEAGLDFRVRHFPVVYALHNYRQLTIAELQKISVLSHSAISQTVKQLMKNDVVAMSVGEDARSRNIYLTEKGAALVGQLLPVWDIARQVIRDIRENSDHDLLLGLDDFEAGLAESSFYQRFTATSRKRLAVEVEIVPFHVKYRRDWYDINKQWVEENFEMEEQDRLNLENPEENILAQGGEICFALVKGAVMGVAALKHHGDREFEVSKMGVRPEARGQGIGMKVLMAVIERFEARGGQKLYLETSHKLPQAIALYEKAGFVHVPRRESPYARADVCMEYRPS